ncbi:FxDxF family PEP-CTERM protein [Paucibacter sp. hw8]|uniref:FxDxF family PEP-CTERM protein n=1 Tax=Roseateles albus TaxID=2987525 RepID=A0ABT5KJS2_9BURK|nr:FxDxF family PEP-CTERM protein [Roseateles albus]MDC8774168.1 FxDxF family PEP-CTERM protein [Roseateles albus]
MKKLNFVAAAVLAASSFSASALTTPWGQHDAIEFGTGSAVGANSIISDFFTFTLAAPVNTVAVAVTNDTAPPTTFANLINASLTLWDVTNNVVVGTVNFDSTAVTKDFGSLAAGSYKYAVSAQVAANAIGGSYLVTSSVTPVPEPSTYALLLAGLGAIGFVARRRKSA